MNRVVYLLGAGFSRPLGLPLITDFLVMAKDMVYNNFTKYSKFEKVLKQFDEMSYCKNYYNADLFNIEEILSILEMQSFLRDNPLSEDIINLVCEVINYYTPKISPDNSGKRNVDKLFLTSHELWRKYFRFLSGLFSVEYRYVKDMLEESTLVMSRVKQSTNVKYSILTLNYDMILESAAQYINNLYGNSYILTFQPTYDGNSELPFLAKLHGSTDSRMIVPPTWSKGNNKTIVPVWTSAFSALQDANELRIIGYSLPTTDSYIKYLLKAAILNSINLKKIEVICLDKNGSVKNRFDEFILFNYYQFYNTSTENYLEFSPSHEESGKFTIFDHLEPMHTNFIRLHKS